MRLARISFPTWFTHFYPHMKIAGNSRQWVVTRFGNKTSSLAVGLAYFLQDRGHLEKGRARIRDMIPASTSAPCESMQLKRAKDVDSPEAKHAAWQSAVDYCFNVFHVLDPWESAAATATPVNEMSLFGVAGANSSLSAISSPTRRDLPAP